MKVEVTRTEYATTTFDIPTDDPEEAYRAAWQMAIDYEWPSAAYAYSEADYEIDVLED